jgi:hypothetical protein
MVIHRLYESVVGLVMLFTQKSMNHSIRVLRTFDRMALAVHSTQ